MSVGGSALVVLLVIAAAAFVRGMDRAVRATGSPRNIIILGTGSEESIERSEVGAGVAGIVAASIQGLRSRAGTAYVSPEVYVQLPVAAEGGPADPPLVAVRGITPPAMLVHADVQIVEGRLPEAGRDEVMLGRAASRKMDAPDVPIGATVSIDARPWTVVGRFAAPGTVTEAEVWAPLTDLKAATRRDTDSCVIVTLDDAEFADVAAFTKTRVDLELAAMPESAYYQRLSDFFGPIRIVTWVTAALIALGGLLGGLNTMYAAFASRVRELGTLQALGYKRPALVASLAQESILATAAGALLASAGALALLDGLSVRFSMGVFGLVVDAPVVAAGLIAGIVLGLVGALPPAYRCLRLNIPVALKAH
jgi:putative ABC transport system permease protein